MYETEQETYKRIVDIVSDIELEQWVDLNDKIYAIAAVCSAYINMEV